MHLFSNKDFSVESINVVYSSNIDVEYELINSMFPVIRRVFAAQTLASEILSVQPMTMPVGLFFLETVKKKIFKFLRGYE